MADTDVVEPVVEEVKTETPTEPGITVATFHKIMIALAHLAPKNAFAEGAYKAISRQPSFLQQKAIIAQTYAFAYELLVGLQMAMDTGKTAGEIREALKAVRLLSGQADQVPAEPEVKPTEG